MNVSSPPPSVHPQLLSAVWSVLSDFLYLYTVYMCAHVGTRDF